MEYLRKNKLLAAIGGLVVAGFVAWLAFGFFGIQAAFIDESVDQTDPFAGRGHSRREHRYRCRYRC